MKSISFLLYNLFFLIWRQCIQYSYTSTTSDQLISHHSYLFELIEQKEKEYIRKDAS